MSRRDWLKLVVLILIPINAWLCVFYYQKRWRWVRMYLEGAKRDQEIQTMQLNYLRERRGWSIREGLPLRFPAIAQVIGKFPPIGRGVPVLFLYISWCAEPEVWELAVEETLKTDPTLHIALLYDLPTTYKDGKLVIDTKRLPLARQLWEKFTKQFQTDRISVLTSWEWSKVLGAMRSGILAVVCDGGASFGLLSLIRPCVFRLSGTKK
ncbi:hypothetical protein B0813_001807 [Candidatus Fervidibacteria bacterium JGI MDM2 SSWTFF-3-K9]